MMTKEELMTALGARDDVPELLEEAAERMKDGAFDVGDIVLMKNGVPWRLVDLQDDGAVIMTAVAFDYAPFSRPTKRHPWGWNNYMDSQIRQDLNSVYPEQLLGEEKELLIKHDDERGIMWLLSEEEAGFIQGESTYEYFRDEDPDKAELKRQLIDLDGDETYWWLRSPNPSNASDERTVNTDGSLGNDRANDGIGAVAACAIKK